MSGYHPSCLEVHDRWVGIQNNQLEDEDDTSYFDSRSERYNHDLENDTDGEGVESSAEDSVSDDPPLFRTFSSCSPSATA